MHSVAQLRDAFVARFGRACQVVSRAPGRVNLIGEHTDYNDGYVLPIAIEQSAWAAAAPRSDQTLCASSTHAREQRSWPIDRWTRTQQPHWTSYVAGVATLLRRRGARLGGCDLLIESDVPPGGGLASSAALEVAVALALAYLSGEPLEATELIDLCRQAEHEFAGVPCGLMDQTVSLLAQQDTALLLDCRARKAEHVPARLDGHAILVIDSGVRHELAAGEYVRRQEQCRAAVEYFQRFQPNVRGLRDVSLDTVRAHASQMDPLGAARSMHVASEIERTLAAAKALRGGRLDELGQLMKESHRSLRDDYEVSCPEIERLVDAVREVPGVLGARLTGAGFGGCVVVLARASSVEPLAQLVTSGGRPPLAASVLRVRPARGAGLEFT